ncbi:MAG: hypothetical protein ACREA0_33935, partial [bacterium]
ALATAVTSEVEEMEDNLAQTASNLGAAGVSDDDTTEIEADEISEVKGHEAADDNPSFSDIFPGNEVDITDDDFEPEPEVARVSARPWERG